ncbi:MAG: orotidine-5'-phosphate decarboxylase [Rhodospirillaceae bacterium]|nr:orotidine-5'-phosphate decarboxylase [Rhodospirillaceae bacterium]
MRQQAGGDRLIVPLDVSTHEDALRLVNTLTNVSFFKIGLQAFVAGNYLDLLKEIQQTRAEDGGVFIDLKLSGDIGNTIRRFVETLIGLNVKLLTLSESVATSKTAETINTIRDVRNEPEQLNILMVPMLSSLDDTDRAAHEFGDPRDTNTFIVDRGEKLLELGCDGLIVSGDAIGVCRNKLNCLIVSPGIRPAGFPPQDHKRFTTPAEAIRMGADRLVVGRPVIHADDPKGAAQAIMDEIDSVP